MKLVLAQLLVFSLFAGDLYAASCRYMIAEKLPAILDAIDFSQYSAPTGHQNKRHLIWYKDGVHRLRGILVGRKGNRLFFVVQQSLPYARVGESTKRKYRWKLVSEPMSQLELSSLSLESPNVKLTLKKTLFGEQSMDMGPIEKVQKTQITFKNGKVIKIDDIKELKIPSAKRVMLTTNSGAIIMGVILKDSKKALWVLSATAERDPARGFNGYKTITLHKLSHTEYRARNIHFDAPKLYNDFASRQKSELGETLSVPLDLTKANLQVQSMYSTLKGLPITYLPKDRIVRRHYTIQGVSPETHPHLRFSTNGKIEIGADLDATRSNALKLRITKNINPTQLTPGIYNYVVTKAGNSLDFKTGLIQGNNESTATLYGLEHHRLAQGDPVILSGELKITSSGDYFFNTKDPSYMSDMIRHHPFLQPKYIEVAGKMFQKLFNKKGNFLGYHTRAVGNNIVTEQIPLSSEIMSIEELQRISKLKSFSTVNPDIAEVAKKLSK